MMNALLDALEVSDDLRHEPWRGSDCPVTGHCYVASEAAYHLLGGKDAGYTPCFVRHEGAPHWYLIDPSGQVLDITAEQFATTVPYDRGTRKGFLTKVPSKRAAILIERALHAWTNDYMDQLSERMQEPPSMHDGGFK